MIEMTVENVYIFILRACRALLQEQRQLKGFWSGSQRKAQLILLQDSR